MNSCHFILVILIGLEDREDCNSRHLNVCCEFQGEAVRRSEQAGFTLT